MSNQWKLVPVEPTESMVINGFESAPDECFSDEEVWEQYQGMSGCQQAAFRAKLCWAAMIAAAPAPDTHIAVPEESAGVDFGIDGRSVRVSQEAYSIFLAREAAGREKIAALQQRLTAADKVISEQRVALMRIHDRAEAFAEDERPMQVASVEVIRDITTRALGMDSKPPTYKPGLYAVQTMRAMPDNSVDSIVTDPPYGLSFMGKKWDYDVPTVEIWVECLRVLKPGGHLLAFAGTRTQHRMAVRIEDAGFEIRDMIAWVYGSGFPKSMSVSKAIDKAAGAERELTRPGVDRREGYGEDWDKGDSSTRPRYDIPATDKAAQWEGWGTALKPALEPITVARKPFAGIVAANVLKFGTGAINIDACRVSPTGERLGGGDENGKGSKPDGWARPWMSDPDHVAAHGLKVAANVDKASQLGRWPANLIHDGSEPADLLGDAARFFYCAKTGKKDRNEGLDAFPETTTKTFEGGKIASGKTPDSMGGERTSRNSHPTVKPTELMAYLLRLVTPPGGTALDPFMGSGSTGKAAMREGFKFIGCEIDEQYAAIARARIEHEAGLHKSRKSETDQIDLFATA